MYIDNSRATKWHFCPAAFQERYVHNLEPIKRDNSALEFGTRVHQLLEMHYQRLGGLERTSYPPLANEALEAEAQAMYEGYCASYPVEEFDVVEVERFFEVPLLVEDAQGRVSAKHTYIGEFDGIIRMRSDGALWLLETKTEKRGSKSNLPEAWANRPQVGLYVWAAEKVYGEVVKGILLNVLTRQSPKGQELASYRRDHLERTEAQKRQAVENIIWVADQIEAMEAEYGKDRLFPQDRTRCFDWFPCEYRDLHVGDTRPDEQLIQLKFKQADEYLAGLEGAKH